jgi:predicted RNA binding protein YcfA (HicA-like mRNA interferase family)
VSFRGLWENRQNVPLPYTLKALDIHYICCVDSKHDRQASQKILEEQGWLLDGISGSHHIMIRVGNRSIPIPVHGSNDLPKGMVHAILKQAGIKE